MKIVGRLVLLLALASAPALAETRVALVIGNAAYRHAPALANPKNDAEAMAASLKRLGFEVLAGTDLEKPAMDKLLQAFADKLEKADVALVFYAGHGLQVSGRNYLVPVDGKLDKESDLVFQAVALDTIQGLMEQGSRTSIMILDACRDNPLARNLVRSMGTRSAGIGRGLGATQAGVGTLIVYATQPGNVALDGETGANSPFTAALLAHLETKGLEVRQVLTRVRQAVIEKTRGKQVPWDSSSLTGDFFFVAAPAAREAPPAEAKPPAATPPATSETPRGPSADSENLFWQSIKDSKSAADFKDYLQRWPSGTFAELAKRRIAELEKAADVTPPAPTPEKPAPPTSDKPARKRISTFLPQTVMKRSVRSFRAQKTATPQQCRDLCLADPRCQAWDHYTVNYSPARQDPEHLACSLFSSVASTEANSLYHAGVIRTAPAAAPAAPQTGDAILREVIRKAQAREEEKGICAHVTSPYDTPLAAVTVAEPGRPAIYKTRGGCGVVSVKQITMRGDRKCKLVDAFECFRGKCDRVDLEGVIACWNQVNSTYGHYQFER